ncbi:LLM class flavin-dependent oxidoreductase [Mycetocola manganoxydans]|uniref:LLM class flavin-dependent oxidoreductase n=1 Tax=Mycetocola manganoxydans TaxID=699879 RepID=A0A3L6ZQF3_9MICO|nr:LLM class flavin-dependent oxidoreductase [Mycetocola manganoxydans]RLP69811.1 LLM class flavin-dependent oxidoreductase [Mycetocola manganoxydans]GHD50133.1 alkanal monooxygenase subunit alpha [Mycetocola manganoxydans]
MKLSVLDLVPVRSRQSSAEALAAAIDLAQVADELGFERYWVAEHHNMPSVASTNPAVIIGILAAHTKRIRVGSGGVMLPNHAPLVVAEQFALLEAAAPGRIDLGLGRAPGSDPVVTAVLNRSGATSDVNSFPNYVSDIAALLSEDGATVRLTSGTEYELRATPAATSTPNIWLLGSSDYSATLAASLGLPYVFAHHFAGAGAERALEIYRSQFQPSPVLDAPRTFVTANVVAAPTAAEAYDLALPNLQMMARLRTNEQLGRLATVEEAKATTMTPLQDEFIAASLSSWIIDEPEAAARRVRELAKRFDVDEVMVSPGASAHDADPANRTPGRASTLRLLAEQLALVPAA